MIRFSSILKNIILACIAVNMGYLLIFNIDKDKMVFLQIIISVIGIITALVAILSVYSRYCPIEIRTRVLIEFRKLNIYIIPYLLIILYEGLHTKFMYGYNNITLMYAVTPYLYVLFGYPLSYIFTVDGSYLPFLKKVSILGIVMTVIRVTGWFFYNYYKLPIFLGIVLQTPDWTRNGLQRIDVVPLYGIIVVILLSNYLKSNKIKDLVMLLILVCYPIFVTQVRYLTIVVLITIISMIYLKPSKSSKFVFVKILLSIALSFSVIFGVIQQVVALFSPDSLYGPSTSVRIEAIDHFYNLVNTTGNQFSGLGYLLSWNGNAAQLLSRNIWQNYYLSDLGIFGGLVVFGLLGIVVYGLLYYLGIKSVIDNWNHGNANRIMVMGIFIYMVLSCFSLNIFDMNRAMDVPFYLAIFCYTSAKSRLEH